MINGQKAYRIKASCIALTALLMVSVIAITINFNQQVSAINNNNQTPHQQ